MLALLTRPIPWLITLATVAGAVVVMRFEGRPWWCRCGKPNLWVSDIWSEHCSQHLVDPYVFTHVSHGMIFYALFALVLRRSSFGWKLCAANLVECAWEVLENTNWAIERYRATTISIGYVGDSVANSLGDIGASALGACLARVLGFKVGLAVFVLSEVVLAVMIRDNLSLNVVMLLHPFQAIKAWQSAGHVVP